MNGLGPEWREVSYVEYRDGGVPPGRTATVRIGDEDPHYFIRDEPLPALPTEPYTVIQVTWRDSDNVPCVYMLHPSGKWGPYEIEYLSPNITSFEVLAEPCAVTAGRIFDRMADLDQQGIAPADVIDRAAAEFGADA